MNKLSILLAFLLYGIFNVSAQCTDFVDIPDANFKAALVGNIEINTDGDGEISCEEAIAFTGAIDVVGSFRRNTGIVTLDGIEYFTNITGLNCGNNKLTNLDVSNNKALIELSCYGNELTSLDVSNNKALIELSCRSNELTSLDVSSNVNLEVLSFYNNHLTSIDVSNNIFLNVLYFSNNNLTSLDVSNNKDLTYLNCGDNELTSLDVSNNTELNYLFCSGNNLTSLDVSNNKGLIELFCSSNNLTSLDLSEHTNFKRVGCIYNKITKLDLSNSSELFLIECRSNNLISLNLGSVASRDLEVDFFQSLMVNDNPDLTCVQVEDVEYFTNSWSHAVDEGVIYSENCEGEVVLSIIDNEFSESVSLYPNPIIDNLNIVLKTGDELGYVEVYNLLGELILMSSENVVDSNSLSSGIYILKIINTNGKVGVRKIIKE